MAKQQNVNVIDHVVNAVSLFLILTVAISSFITVVLTPAHLTPLLSLHPFLWMMGTGNPLVPILAASALSAAAIIGGLYLCLFLKKAKEVVQPNIVKNKKKATPPDPLSDIPSSKVEEAPVLENASNNKGSKKQESAKPSKRKSF